MLLRIGTKRKSRSNKQGKCIKRVWVWLSAALELARILIGHSITLLLVFHFKIERESHTICYRFVAKQTGNKLNDWTRNLFVETNNTLMSDLEHSIERFP